MRVHVCRCGLCVACAFEEHLWVCAWDQMTWPASTESVQRTCALDTRIVRWAVGLVLFSNSAGRVLPPHQAGQVKPHYAA